MTPRSIQAWNNFCLRSEPSEYEKGSTKWAAATAKRFMNSANNGGLNFFLTSSWDIDTNDVVGALRAIGAQIAVSQLEEVLQGLGVSLPAGSQQERWDVLDSSWNDALDPFDFLSDKAEAELMVMLTAHVEDAEDFYIKLGTGRP